MYMHLCVSAWVIGCKLGMPNIPSLLFYFRIKISVHAPLSKANKGDYSWCIDNVFFFNNITCILKLVTILYKQWYIYWNSCKLVILNIFIHSCISNDFIWNIIFINELLFSFTLFFYCQYLDNCMEDYSNW